MASSGGGGGGGGGGGREYGGGVICFSIKNKHMAFLSDSGHNRMTPLRQVILRFAEKKK